MAKVGYWELDFETNKLYWSDEVYTIWGLDKNKSIFDFEEFHSSIHPDDVQEFDWNNDRAIAGIAPLDFKHRIILENGEIKWVHEKRNSLSMTAKNDSKELFRISPRKKFLNKD